MLQPAALNPSFGSSVRFQRSWQRELKQEELIGCPVREQSKIRFGGALQRFGKGLVRR